jgi:hypothetical protein
MFYSFLQLFTSQCFPDVALPAVTNLNLSPNLIFLLSVGFQPPLKLRGIWVILSMDIDHWDHE